MRKFLILTWLFVGPFVGTVTHADVDDSRWATTLERIASGVVTIQIDQTRSFDTEWNSSGQATGFVIDAKRGLILTNRHVVTPGPVTAQAVFQNREEVALYPVYRDPVHDFGIYRYDPAKLRFITPAELPLYPQGAVIGRDIRVVGNDAGEQLSILTGTLARLDRQAPEYGPGKYNDFNTFYYQAASGTSGGSSGSPVIDIEGRVIALNAGGSTQAASSFYLPLPRVLRAVKLIQDGKRVSRGTLQTVFAYTPYDELKRLGLDADTEAAVRRKFPKQTGMLVVNEVQPGSMAEHVLEPGDVLLKINGEFITTFEPMEEMLDSAVGTTVKIELRRGNETRVAELKVQDLYEITPDRFLTFGDAVVHTLSWQQARHMNRPVSGVYVANPGYVLGAAGVPRTAVITEINGQPLASVEDFARIVREFKDGEHATLRYFTLDDPRAAKVAVMRMDRRWYPAAECQRDDVTGVWPCENWPIDGVAPPPQPVTTQFAKSYDPLIKRVAPSLVMVRFDMPYAVSGYTDRSFYGTGVVIDAQRGLVAVDRNTVPVPVGDLRLTFAGAVEVPGKVEYVHPSHNLTIVSYDPKLLGDTPIRAATLNTQDLKPGDGVYVVGLDTDSRIKSQSATVAQVEAAAFPLSRTLRFRESNVELIDLVNGPENFDGVLVNKKGEVLATWSSFLLEQGRDITQVTRGVPSAILAQTLTQVITQQPLHSLEAELTPLSLADARRLSLPDNWLKALTLHDEEHGREPNPGGTARSQDTGDLCRRRKRQWSSEGGSGLYPRHSRVCPAVCGTSRSPAVYRAADFVSTVGRREPIRAVIRDVPRSSSLTMTTDHTTAVLPTTHDLPVLMTIIEVAEHLGVTVRHVRRLVAERRIPYIKWGHLLRFDPTQITQWLADQHKPVSHPLAIRTPRQPSTPSTGVIPSKVRAPDRR